MKLILTTLIVSLLLACTAQHDSSTKETIDLLDQNGNSKPRGGVDVGPNVNGGQWLVINKKSLRPIPGTLLFVSVSFGWKETTLENGLKITHHDGSTITITKASIEGNSTPTAAAVKEYLKVKYPERNYSDIQINGSEGVSAEIAVADGRIETDIYLVSELKDFIHVRMNLQHKGMVLTNGQSVLGTIQIKRAGEPVALSVVKQVTLQAGMASKEVPLVFAQTSSTSLKVRDSKKNSGYIVEIPSSSEPVKFEQIKASGQGITFGNEKVIPVENIFIVFRSHDRTLPRGTLNLKAGGVYIVRTDNWPFQDIVTKLLVESLEPGKSVTLKYQKLLVVNPGILVQQPRK